MLGGRRRCSDWMKEGKDNRKGRCYAAGGGVPIAFPLLEFQKVHGGDEENQGEADED